MSIKKAVTTIFVLTLLWSSSSFAATGDVNGDGKIGLEEAIYPAFIRLELIFPRQLLKEKYTPWVDRQTTTLIKIPSKYPKFSLIIR